METVFIIISSILTIGAVLPYLRDILKRQTKPRIVSWFTWALLSALASAASFSDGQYAAGILSLCASLECLAVVVLGLKYGERNFTRFDIVCQVGALAGLVLWLIFNSPAIAVIAAVTIDFIGCLPTLKHAWQKPHEETWITFMLSGLGAAFTLMATGNWQITSVANPLYLVAINAVFTAILLSRQQKLRMV